MTEITTATTRSTTSKTTPKVAFEPTSGTVSAIPGLRPRSELGYRRHQLRFFRDPVAYLNPLFQEHGNLSALVPTWNVSKPGIRPTVYVYGPELNHEVLSQHEIYHKESIGEAIFSSGASTATRDALKNLGGSLFRLNGEEHRQHRRLMLPAFHRKRIEQYYTDMVSMTQQMLDSWPQDKARNLRDDFVQLTMRIVTKTIFGEDVTEHDKSIGQALQDSLQLLLNPAVVLLQFDIPGLPFHHFLQKAAEIDQRMRTIIERKRASGLDEGDMLSMLLQARFDDGEPLSEDMLIEHAGFIFAAGHEITAALVDELGSVLHGAPPTIEQLQQLPLLERVIKESLRILPPAPFNMRNVAEPTDLGGYSLDKGTVIFTSIYHTNHMPETYQDPERFNPDRWLTIDPSPFEYNPFGAGPRMCLGAPFAQMELKIILSMLFQRYRLEFIPGTKIERVVAAAMAIKGGLPMMIRQQDGQFKQSVGNVKGNIHEMVRLPE